MAHMRGIQHNDFSLLCNLTKIKEIPSYPIYKGTLVNLPSSAVFDRRLFPSKLIVLASFFREFYALWDDLSVCGSFISNRKPRKFVLIYAVCQMAASKSAGSRIITPIPGVISFAFVIPFGIFRGTKTGFPPAIKTHTGPECSIHQPFFPLGMIHGMIPR